MHILTPLSRESPRNESAIGVCNKIITLAPFSRLELPTMTQQTTINVCDPITQEALPENPFLVKLEDDPQRCYAFDPEPLADYLLSQNNVAKWIHPFTGKVFSGSDVTRLCDRLETNEATKSKGTQLRLLLEKKIAFSTDDRSSVESDMHEVLESIIYKSIQNLYDVSQDVIVALNVADREIFCSSIIQQWHQTYATEISEWMGSVCVTEQIRSVAQSVVSDVIKQLEEKLSFSEAFNFESITVAEVHGLPQTRFGVYCHPTLLRFVVNFYKSISVRLQTPFQHVFLSTRLIHQMLQALAPDEDDSDIDDSDSESSEGDGSDNEEE